MSLGGGGGSQQTGQQTTVTELPSWARPYAQNILAKGEALTDINKNPYQTYGAPRQAGFSPMEEQAFAGAANLAPSQAGLAGQDVALGASLGALNTGQFGVPQAQQYMNPYLESALAPQMELMRRQQGAQAQQMAGQATQVGAFGGSRYGLAQAQQNLANQLAQQNLVGQGYNTAFQQAMQQYNADQARRLQGLSTALQGAGQLGQLGAQQFGQQQAAIGMQGQMGAQQRAMEQQGLDIAYQDFLNQQNYPYRQLGFMSDLLRGTPTGSSSSMNMYQAPGSMLGQLGGIGMGLYGLSRAGLFKEGGEVEGYAKGGKTDLEMLSDDQLKLSYKNALARGDIGLAQAIQAQLMENTALRNAQQASLSGGLGYAFDQLPTDQQENVMSAAGGGIVAFAGEEDSDVKDENARLLARSRTQKQMEAQKNAPRPAPKSTASAPSNTSAPARSITEAAQERGFDLKDAFIQMQEMLKDPEAAKLLQENADEIKRYAARAEGMKQQRGANALAEFGFRMASEAAKPGARFLGSAATASPTIMESVRRSEEIEQRMADNAMKMRQLQNQSVIAMRKGDRQAAIQGAAQLRMLDQAQQQLALKRDELKNTAGYQAGMLKMYENRNAAQAQRAQNQMLGQISRGMGQTQATAVRMAKDYLATPAGMQDKRPYADIVAGFQKQLGKNYALGVGFSPATEDDED